MVSRKRTSKRQFPIFGFSRLFELRNSGFKNCKNCWLTCNLEFDSLEEWIESKNYTDKEKTHYTEEHDSIKNLKLGGMDYLELKLQVDESHKLLYCDIPKTGSSVWMRIMLKLTQDKGLD